MCTYYALTTTYPAPRQWTIVAAAATAAEARDAGEKSIVGSDIYADTLRKNLRVMSMTRATREHYIPRDFAPQQHPAFNPQVSL